MASSFHELTLAWQTPKKQIAFKERRQGLLECQKSLYHNRHACPEVLRNGAWARDSASIRQIRVKNLENLSDASAGFDPVAELSTFDVAYTLNISMTSPRHDDPLWQEATQAFPALLEQIPESLDIRRQSFLFPNLKTECLALLDDILNRRILGSKIGRYQAFIRNYDGGQLKLVDDLLDHVEPQVLHLAGKVVDRETLDGIRASQSGRWPSNVGYLDYITDDRSDLYIRLYIGQTMKAYRRILAEHLQQILSGSFRSLHYFILWLGNGHRSANFLRLWSIPRPSPDQPQSTDSETMADLLETLFIRAFKSDHGACAARSPVDSLSHLRIGLNIATPLTTQNTFAFPPTDSPDPQINVWEQFRHKYRKRQKESGTRTQGTDISADWCFSDCHKALGTSIDDESCLEELQAHLTTSGGSAEPNKAPPVAFVLDFAAVADCDLEAPQTCVNDENDIPWALSKTGFCGENAVSWTIDKQPLGLPTASHFLRMSEHEQQALTYLNRLRVSRSNARIVVLCGGRAVAHAAPDSCKRDERPRNDYLQLHQAFKYRFWVSKDDGAVARRLYIELPALPAGPHSIDMKGATHFSTLFKFISAILGLNNTRPYFIESGSALGSILRLRSHQKLGIQAPALSDLDEGLKMWLLRKGFSENDMVKLEQTAGDIVTGLIMLLRVLPWAPKPPPSARQASGTSTKPEIRWDGWERLDRDRLADVRKLYDDITAKWRARLENQGRTPSQTIRHVQATNNQHELLPYETQGQEAEMLDQEAEMLDQDAEMLDQEAEMLDQEAEMLDQEAEILGQEVGTLNQKPKTKAPKANHITESQPISSTVDQETEHPTGSRPTSPIPSMDQVSEQDLRWLLKSTQQMIDIETVLRSDRVREGAHISNWVAERGKTHLYRYAMTESNGAFQIKVVVMIEIADEDHPRKYASNAQREDPARHIAFRISGMNKEGKIVTFYPQSRSLKSIFRTNQLADRIIYGHDGRQSAEKSRRYAYIWAPTKEDLPPELQRFYKGAYTEDVEGLVREEDFMEVLKLSDGLELLKERLLLRKPFAGLEPGEGLYMVGFLYGSITTVIVVLVFFFMPEMTNRSLEDIDDMMESKVPAWRTRNWKATGLGARLTELENGDKEVTNEKLDHVEQVVDKPDTK